MHKYFVMVFVGLLLFSAQAMAAPLILNEFNAVGNDDMLKDGGADTYFGQILGNGGDWIELVVVEDHLDIRGWSLQWLEDNDEGNGLATSSGVWDPSRVSSNQAQGIITFTNDLLWSDLRAGTILTLSEKTAAGTFDLGTDTSFDPANGDWWIHVSTQYEANLPTVGLVTTTINVDEDPAGSFTVGKSKWELSIVDETGTVVYGPIGEDVSGWDGGGIGTGETGRLEADPGDMVGVGDYDDGYYSSFGSPNVWSDYAETQDFSSLRAWASVPEPSTWILLLGLASLLAVVRKR